MEPIQFSNTAYDELILISASSIDKHSKDSINKWAIGTEAFFEVLLICLSIVGNVLVILSFIMFKRLRTIKSNVIFVSSLASADLLVAICVMPFHIVQNILGYWPFGGWFCKFFTANDVFFCTASLLGIICIAIERYVAVFKPLQYRAVMTTRLSVSMTVIAWVVSLLVSYIPIQLNWHVMPPNGEAFNVTASENHPEQCGFVVNPTYAVVSSIISFWLPSVVMLFVYMKMYIAAKKQLSALSQTNYTPGTINSRSKDFKLMHEGSNSQISEVTCMWKSKARGRTPPNIRTEVTLGRILGCFVFCWLPFFTLLVIDSVILEKPLDAKQYGWLFKATLWLGYANSTANPFIYALSNREFRPYLKRIKLVFRSKNSQKNLLNMSSSFKTSSVISNKHRFSGLVRKQSNDKLRNDENISNYNQQLGVDDNHGTKTQVPTTYPAVWV